MRPTLALLVKLASIARHVEEANGLRLSPFARQAASSLTRDPEVREWLQAADRYALLPATRR